MVYKFIGTEAEIGGVRLRRLGDSIEIPDSDAEELILGAGSQQGFAGAVALLPDGIFESIGFTDEQMTRYGTSAAREAIVNSNSEGAVAFKQKYKAAMEALHEHRMKVESEKAVTNGGR